MRNAVVLLSAALALSAAAKVNEPAALCRDRRKALATLAENVYGVRPELKFERRAEVVKTEEVKELNAVRRVVKLNTMTPLGETTFPVVAYFPKKEGKVPAFVYLSFKPSTETKNPRWPLELILGRGCATAAVCYNDVLRDDPHVLDGIRRPANGWGAISAWALAASRVAEWLKTQAEVDGTKLAVVGHSRLGKTALWAGANDTSFALVCSNDSGLFGARMTSRNLYGETIDQITDKFPHWFAPNCRAKWLNRENELPFDQHWAIAAVAPRLMAIGSAKDDWWACPPGEMAGWEYGRGAWKDISDCDYHVRDGGHDLTSVDWTAYLDFAARKGWPTR